MCRRLSQSERIMGCGLRTMMRSRRHLRNSLRSRCGLRTKVRSRQNVRSKLRSRQGLRSSLRSRLCTALKLRSELKMRSRLRSTSTVIEHHKLFTHICFGPTKGVYKY
jgi:hypothetical protein